MSEVRSFGLDAQGNEVLIEESRIQRAATALFPFVHRMNLPLNPEDLDLMAVAVLKHVDDTSSFTEITNDVEQMIDENFQAHLRMMQKMPGASPQES